MYNEIKKNLVNLMKRAVITEINRFCDLIRIRFKLIDGRNLNFHLQCFFRIFDARNRIIVCTQNLYTDISTYRRKKYKLTDNATLFDYIIKVEQSLIFTSQVKKLIVDGKDMKIFFENETRMEIIESMSKYDDKKYQENYRIFGDNEEENHFII